MRTLLHNQDVRHQRQLRRLPCNLEDLRIQLNDADRMAVRLQTDVEALTWTGQPAGHLLALGVQTGSLRGSAEARAGRARDDLNLPALVARLATRLSPNDARFEETVRSCIVAYDIGITAVHAEMRQATMPEGPLAS